MALGTKVANCCQEVLNQQVLIDRCLHREKSMEGGPAYHIAGYNKVQILLSQSSVFISL